MEQIQEISNRNVYTKVMGNQIPPDTPVHKEISTLLVRTPNVCGGRLRIDGTRVTVNQIVVWYRQGYNPEEITELYPHLNLAQIYTALAYYHANREETEADLDSEEKEAEILEQRYIRSGDMCYADSVVY